MSEPWSARWRAFRWIAVALWVALILRLMVADVWDETNGMVFFSDPSKTVGVVVRFALTESVGFWRPLPMTVAAAILHFVPDFSISWRLLRLLNAALLLASLAILLRVIDAWSPEASERRRFIVTCAFLFSPAAIIVAGWYANIFDASSLFLIALALWQQVKGRHRIAGVLYGTGFFCKETTALVLPFLLVLVALQRIRLRDAVAAGVPAAAIGALYFALRGILIPFGSPADTHGFETHRYLPSLAAMLESFWFQDLKSDGPRIAGFAATIVSLAAIARVRVVAALAGVLAAMSVIYWGMFIPYQNGFVISYQNFIGRLFLVPAAMFLLVLATLKRERVIVLLLIPLFAGAWATYRDHLRFQFTYKRVYRTARDAEVKPLKVQLKTDPTKPLVDPVRGIVVGDIPDAHIRIDPKTGRIEF